MHYELICAYRWENPLVLVRIVVFTAYSLCLSLNMIRFFYVLFYYIRTFLKTKEWTMTWYYYLDIIIYGISSTCLYWWFKNLALRNTFVLPFENEQVFEEWTKNSQYIKNFLKLSPIAVIFLCIKNLQIFSVYFPAYGVLFDTIKKSKNNAISFFIMSLVLSMGFIIMGNLCFGAWSPDYLTLSDSALSLFFILMGQPQASFSDIHVFNPVAALYFFPAAILFQIILINIFLTLVIKEHDRIRKQKQLQSEAIAAIIYREYEWKMQMWYNFLVCRLDRRSKEEVFREKEEGKKMEDVRLKNDIKTTFLFNKVQLFGENRMRTKEEYEREIFENKVKIIKKKKIDILKRLNNFKSGNKKL